MKFIVLHDKDSITHSFLPYKQRCKLFERRPAAVGGARLDPRGARGPDADGRCHVPVQGRLASAILTSASPSSPSSDNALPTNLTAWWWWWWLSALPIVELGSDGRSRVRPPVPLPPALERRRRSVAACSGGSTPLSWAGDSCGRRTHVSTLWPLSSSVEDTSGTSGFLWFADSHKACRSKRKKSSVHRVSTVHGAYTSSWCVP